MTFEERMAEEERSIAQSKAEWDEIIEGLDEMLAVYGAEVDGDVDSDFFSPKICEHGWKEYDCGICNDDITDRMDMDDMRNTLGGM